MPPLNEQYWGPCPGFTMNICVAKFSKRDLGCLGDKEGHLVFCGVRSLSFEHTHSFTDKLPAMCIILKIHWTLPICPQVHTLWPGLFVGVKNRIRGNKPTIWVVFQVTKNYFKYVGLLFLNEIKRWGDKVSVPKFSSTGYTLRSLAEQPGQVPL